MLAVFTVSLLTANIDAWWPGLILLGFMIGIITGLFGIGGGFLLTPCLKIIFNVSYPVAIGSSLLQIFLTSMLSGYKHWKNKNLDTKMGAITAVGGLVGTECGVRILRLVASEGTVDIGGHAILFEDLMINLCFLVLLVLVAVFMYREACMGDQCELDEPHTELGELVRSCPLPPFMCFDQSDIARLSVWMPIVLSLVVGFLTGLLGIGGGFISFPLLVYVLGMPTKIAVGTSTLQVFLASGYGTFRHMQDGHVDVLLVFFMLIGSALGVNIGVKLCKKISSRKTRKYFVGLVVLAILLVACDLLSRLL